MLGFYNCLIAMAAEHSLRILVKDRPSLDPLHIPPLKGSPMALPRPHLETTNVSRAARLMPLFGRSRRPAIGSWIRYQDPLIDCIMMHACKCFPSYKIIPNSKIKVMPGLPSEALGVS